MKLYINTRSALKVIDIDTIVYLKADGNYTHFFYRDGKDTVELPTMAFYIESIESQYLNAEKGNPFHRMGRSYYINTEYIHCIDFQHLQVIFNDPRVKPITSTKGVLKNLRDYVLLVNGISNDAPSEVEE